MMTVLSTCRVRCTGLYSEACVEAINERKRNQPHRDVEQRERSHARPTARLAKTRKDGEDNRTDVHPIQLQSQKAEPRNVR